MSDTLVNPATVALLIHCHCSAEPPPRPDSQTTREGIKYLMAAGAIGVCPGVKGGDVITYETTPLGSAWVALLVATPKPTVAFVDRDGKLIGRP